MTQSQDVAIGYLRAGLCVLPANLADKRPAVSSWKPYQQRLPTEEDVRRWFSQDQPVCLVAGKVSGNLEMIDFDLRAELFEPWLEKVRATDPSLADRLLIESSQSGGRHVVYRCEAPVNGNMQLVQRRLNVDGSDEVTVLGKTFRPRKDADGQWHIVFTLIETRGEGGLFLCAPSAGYELQQGDFTNLPVLTAGEREILLDAAWSLNDHLPQPVDDAVPGPVGGRPGDEFNERGDVREILRCHGWTQVRSGDNEYWRRPGKTSGWSATLKDGVFFVFSQNATPFEEKRAYSPFSVYTMLEHGGDHTRAAATLGTQGFGGGDETNDVDLSRIESSLQKADSKLRFAAISSKELDENKYDLKYLIEGMLVRGQPGVIAGPKKSLKTNISIDLALSLSNAGAFLKRFNVPEPVRVGVMSGESGAATIQETARRIAEAKGGRLRQYGNVFWCMEVPQLGHLEHTDALREFIKGYELEVLILDPTYLMMLGLGDSAGNLFTVGSFLKSLGDLAHETGCTPLLCHHLKKGIADPYEPAELENIAWAGFQEFVRQWILLNRRVRYDPDKGGHHELWMSVGGSAGHSGLWGVDIDEGTRQDANGRHWSVDVITAAEAYDARTQAKGVAKEQQKQRHDSSKLEEDCRIGLEAISSFPQGETKNIVQGACGFGGGRFNRVLSRLMAEGSLKNAES